MSYTHLTAKDRYVISHLHSQMSYREIARRLGRHHTTISREIKRNKPPHSTYWYYFIERDVERKRHTARSFRRQSHLALVKYVEDKLKLDWPPEAISARLKLDYPHDERMRVSHETIYRWVYLVAMEGGNLHQHLRRRHKKRRRQPRYGSGRRFIAGRVSISQRPPIVDSRERFGDWEGDTLEGRKGCGHLATHVERKSRFLVVAKLVDKRAATMTQATTASFWRLPKSLRHTLTVDNGKEFSRFKELETKTGLTVYFADPYAAWQRGTNENTNGILRHYFPKGFDFSTITDEELELVVKQINNRPRKCLNYRTPAEVMRLALRGALAI
jgi:transposase, IS30 family